MKIYHEMWKSIETHPQYEVSNLGRIKKVNGKRRYNNGYVRKPTKNSRGYLHVCFSRYPKNPISFTVHHLVTSAFLGQCPDGFYVNHVDGNKQNNRVDNLEYVTPSQNLTHAYRIGLRRGRGKNLAHC